MSFAAPPTTQQYYDRFSETYDNERHRGYHRLIDELELDLVCRYGAGKDVFEAGCGTGLLLREAAMYLELGYRTLKVKVGGLTPEADAERVGLIRKAVGKDVAIMLDANQGWNLPTAVTFLFAKSRCASRTEHACSVHPGVSAFG